MDCFVDAEEAAARQRVGFSITAPRGVERWLCELGAGGLGAVHQYLTMLAALQLTATLSDALLEQLCLGVIWNDFPWGEEDVEPKRFRDAIIERIPAESAPYITHPSFRLQANEATRWAVAAVYKNVPTLLCRAFSISEPARQTAAAIMEQRTKPERIADYHFMNRTADDTIERVIAHTSAVCKRWYYRALAQDSFFMFGHLLHLVEDSFSAAHTLRIGANGALAYAYFFGDQTDTSHSRAESYDFVVQEQVRMKWCVAAVAELLQRFVADRAVLLEAAATASRAAREEAAQRMSELVVRDVLLRKTFARAPRL
jgi:hypothetical protein